MGRLSSTFIAPNMGPKTENTLHEMIESFGYGSYWTAGFLITETKCPWFEYFSLRPKNTRRGGGEDWATTSLYEHNKAIMDMVDPIRGRRLLNYLIGPFQLRETAEERMRLIRTTPSTIDAREFRNTGAVLMKMLKKNLKMDLPNWNAPPRPFLSEFMQSGYIHSIYKQLHSSSQFLMLLLFHPLLTTSTSRGNSSLITGMQGSIPSMAEHHRKSQVELPPISPNIIQHHLMGPLLDNPITRCCGWCVSILTAQENASR